MTKNDFHAAIAALTGQIRGRTLNNGLQAWLNTNHGPGTGSFDGIRRLCEHGVAEGWMCEREAGGIRFGRVLKPSEDLHHFSVDVVDMSNLAGPHHRHPNGEIDMIMPLAPSARFDGHGAGWCVYEPDTEHRPTVTHGRALILYLLPQGAIEFTGAKQ